MFLLTILVQFYPFQTPIICVSSKITETHDFGAGTITEVISCCRQITEITIGFSSKPNPVGSECVLAVRLPQPAPPGSNWLEALFVWHAPAARTLRPRENKDHWLHVFEFTRQKFGLKISINYQRVIGWLYPYLEIAATCLTCLTCFLSPGERTFANVGAR